jgi:hypothetical protein
VIGQKAKEAMTGSYYFLVPKDSVFFYREAYILNYLRKSFPRLAKIEIISPELSTIKITVTDKEPKLIWCFGIDKSKKCFYLDETGRTYSEAPDFSENIIFELTGYDLGEKIGQQALPPERLKNVSNFLVFLITVLPELQNVGLPKKILQTKVLSAGDFSVEVGQNASSTFKVLFNADRKTEEMTANLSSVLKNEAFTAEIKNNNQKLEYLDLRFGQKVFYRFR